MNGKALLCILVIAFLLFPFTSVIAQTASAEFISSVSPQKLVSGEQVKDGVQNVFLQGNRLYVANTWAGLQVLDVSDVKNPKEIGKYELTKRTRNVYVDGKYAFLSVALCLLTSSAFIFSSDSFSCFFFNSVVKLRIFFSWVERI